MLQFLLISNSTIHINFHFSWNSVGPLSESCRALYGKIRRSGEPSRRQMTLQNCFVFWSRIHFQIWIYRLSSAQFYVRSVYTSSAILTACSDLSAPRRSRLVTSRRSCRADWRVVSSYPSHRVAFSVRYVLNTCRDWPDALGLIHTASRAEQKRNDPNRFGLEKNLRFEMETLTLHAEQNRTYGAPTPATHVSVSGFSWSRFCSVSEEDIDCVVSVEISLSKACKMYYISTW